MPRPRRAARPAAVRLSAPHFEPLDLDAWAGSVVSHAGRESALLGRVEALRLSPDGLVLDARVRDAGPTPYHVTIVRRGERFDARCECAYQGGPACKHAVAAVVALRFPRPELQRLAGPRGRGRRAGRLARGQGRIVTQAPVQAGTLLAAPGEWTPTPDERVAAFRDEELAGRRQRARKERAKVVKLDPGPGPLRFEVAGRSTEGAYVVTLRGVDGKLASCTCPDYAKAELSTCKHVERVRSWFSRQPKRFPSALLSLWWRPREWTDRVPVPLREIRLDGPDGPLPDELAPWFDADGWLRPSPEGPGEERWTRAAIAAASAVAERRGWTFDLDPAVEALLRDAARAEAERARLETVEIDGAMWREVTSDLGFRLHRYQEAGAAFLARRGRAFLADDMGLGKTVQAVVAALLLRRTAGSERALVVCPASLKHQWRMEIEKACGEHAVVVDGNREARLAAYAGWRGGFLILNYELVLRDLEAIRATRPQVIVLDEAQRIKNWDTKTAKAVKRLDSPHAFVLTGTPLENRLGELHSLMEFLNPRALGPRWRLLPYHSITDPSGRVLAYERLDLLRSRMSPWFLRRERRQVLDQLPPRTDNTFWTEMTAAQWRPYRRYARRVAGLLAHKRALQPSEVRQMLQALTSMRILCNAWAQYAWDAVEHRVRNGSPKGLEDLRWMHSPKIEEFVHVIDDLLEEPGVKVVVFSQWERLLRLAHWAVRGILEPRGERAEIFHGALDARARTRVLEAFTGEESLRVLFSTDAGGVGLNLQEAASIVINLEVPWNPAVLEQRIGRVHRLGQRQSVQVLHFVTRGAIEERVRQVVENKRALFDGLLVDEADRVVLDEASQASFLDRVRNLVV